MERILVVHCFDTARLAREWATAATEHDLLVVGTRGGGGFAGRHPGGAAAPPLIPTTQPVALVPVQ